jgi:hypothetical protein
MVTILTLIVVCIFLFPQARRLHFKLPVRELLRNIGEAMKQRWRKADALERGRIVRLECAFRVIGRVAVSGALLVVALTTASSALALMCAGAAWRVVQPTKQELREACSYRSTGAEDEPRYSW